MPVAALSRTPSLALRSTQAVLAPPVKVVRMVNGLTKSVTVQPPAAPKDAASSAQGTAAALTFNMGFVGYDHKATFAAAELNPADQDDKHLIRVQERGCRLNIDDYAHLSL